MNYEINHGIIASRQHEIELIPDKELASADRLRDR